MIKTDIKAYDCFVAALRYWLNKKGRGAQNFLAVESGVSQTLLSLILNPKATKRAGIDSQEAIIKAAGFKTYEDAIRFGRSLIETGKPPGPPPERPLIVQVKSQADKDIMNGAADNFRGIPCMNPASWRPASAVLNLTRMNLRYLWWSFTNRSLKDVTGTTLQRSKWAGTPWNRQSQKVLS
jgi:hypothetical protein